MSACDLLKPGQRFLSFTVKRLLGRGGMGAVYEVIGGSGRLYALKVLQPTWQDRDEQVQRMLDEGTVMVGIKHPNIVEVHDHGVHKDLVWMLMELLEGETLRALIRRERSLTVETTCSFLRAAGYAAEQCHVLGIIHRDIKPENFMITPDQRVKMLDLGIAHIHCSSLTQEPIGTPAYMAPEQFNTRLGVSPATDVYALGLLGYEMLVGWNPFLRDETGKARNPWELCYEHAFTVPPPLEALGVPSSIAAVITRAIQKDPRARYPSGGVFADAIWAAWKQVREGAGAGMCSSTPAAMPFGTGPVGPLPVAARAPVVNAPSRRLPELADPAAVQAYLTRRRQEAAAVAGGTVRLSLAERDPTCVATDRGVEGRRLARGGTMRLSLADRDPSCVDAERRSRTDLDRGSAPLAAAPAAEQPVSPAPRADRAAGIPTRATPSRRSRARERIAMDVLLFAAVGAILGAGLVVGAALILRKVGAEHVASPPAAAPAMSGISAPEPAPRPPSPAPQPSGEAAPLVNSSPAPAPPPRRSSRPAAASSTPRSAPPASSASRSLFDRPLFLFAPPTMRTRATR